MASSLNDPLLQARLRVWGLEFEGLRRIAGPASRGVYDFLGAVESKTPFGMILTIQHLITISNLFLGSD